MASNPPVPHVAPARVRGARLRFGAGVLGSVVCLAALVVGAGGPAGAAPAGPPVAAGVGAVAPVPVAPPAPTRASGTEARHPGPAYWLFGGDGGVFPFGRGAYEGGMATRRTNAAVVGGAVTPTGVGYWLVAADGGVFAFGDARWKGSLPASALHGRIVGIAPTPEGNGYWVVGADGAVYSFGGTRYYGGLVGHTLAAPIVAISATPTGKGYWLTGADGAVYAFGDAPYLGGVGMSVLQGPVVGMAPTRTGRGYWLAGADGGVYAFGDAGYLGGLSGRPHSTITGIARTTGGDGYWLAGADGGVFGFGAAGYFGSVGASRLNRGIIGIAAGDGIAIPQTPVAPASNTGFDISWPQCGGIRPAPPYGFGVIGVTNGHLFSSNPCLADQWRWATGYGSFAAVYVNTNAPTADELASFTARSARDCGANVGCVLDRWGRKGATDALQAAGGIPAPFWWLDVETGNQWLPDTAANAVILRAMVDQLGKAGKHVGLYSTAYQWAAIAGGYSPGLPTWIPGAPPDSPRAYCSGHDFGGGPAWMAQSGDVNFDTDVLCDAGLQSYRVAFADPAPLTIPEYGAPPPPSTPAPLATLNQAVGLVERGALSTRSAVALAAGARPRGHGTRTVVWLGLLVGAAAALGAGLGQQGPVLVEVAAGDGQADPSDRR